MQVKAPAPRLPSSCLQHVAVWRRQEHATHKPGNKRDSSSAVQQWHAARCPQATENETMSTG